MPWSEVTKKLNFIVTIYLAPEVLLNSSVFRKMEVQVAGKEVSAPLCSGTWTFLKLVMENY